MRLFNPTIDPAKVTQPRLWLVLFGLGPWALAGIAVLGSDWFWPSQSRRVVQWVGALALCLAAFAVLVYEQWFGEVADAILRKDYCNDLDAPHYDRIYLPAPDDDATVGNAVAAVEAANDDAKKKVVVAELMANVVATALKAYKDDSTLPPTIDGAHQAIGKRMQWFGNAHEFRLQRMKYILDRLQSRINDEYTDISTRIGWLMTGQAFLLSAFATILNADRLGADARHWLSTGVAFSGAMISFILSLSTFFGHALMRKLKIPRDEAETIMATQFHVPRAGVPSNHSAHILGHAATRYLPTFFYAAWTCLTLFAWTDRFSKTPSPEEGVGYVLLPPEIFAQSALTQGWTLYAQPTPSFPIGATTYLEPEKGCPDNRNAADEWVDGFIAAWSERRLPSHMDALFIVGSADRVNLSDLLKRKLDSNMSLARGRAEEIKQRLIAKTQMLIGENKLAPIYRISSDHVIVLVTGPRNAASTPLAPVKKSDCNNTELAADRTVQVWIPSRE